MIKVLIADDHPVVRKGLKQILEEGGSIRVVDEASNASEVLKLVAKKTYDVVVLDITMPGRSGIDIIEDIKQEQPKLPILILSNYHEDQYAIRALKEGASGYLMKQSAPDDLVKAVNIVAQGKKYVTPTLAEKMAYDLGNDDKKKIPHERLSKREFSIMCMIASGRSVSDVAENLCLSVKTVSTYRSRILEKTGLKNNSEITHYAVRNGLVE